MLLHDSLDDAVADVFADLPVLADSSRRRGMAIRRRRRILATVGATVAASVLAVAAVTLVPRAGDPGGDVATDVPVSIPAGPLSGEVAPISGRGAVAALAWAVDEVADGTFDGFQGDVLIDDRHASALAAFRFLPVSGSGPAGEVLVNLDPLSTAGEPPYTCAALTFPVTNCTAWDLPTGDTVRTYQDDDTELGVGAQRLTVEVVSPDRRLRLVLGARNTNPYADGELRATPVLTTEQLVEIATQPWWDREELPREFVEAGARLVSYSDANTDQS